MTDKLGAQATVCGGGRYDPLIGMLGGKPAPACGFAMGIERLLDLWSQGGEPVVADRPDVYVVWAGAGTESAALRASEALRRAGLDVVMHAGGGSFKAQFRRADGSGAAFALIIGEGELAAGALGLKPLRADPSGRPGEQRTVPVDGLAEAVQVAILGDEPTDL